MRDTKVCRGDGGTTEEGNNRRLRMILTSELNVKNKITATGALAVPELRYIFYIFNCGLEDIRKIYKKTR